jgi:predicted ATPase
MVLPTVARVLRAPDAAGRAVIDALKECVRHRRQLLVLDNFEHVISAAQVVSHLLISCPRLTVLVTSREALRLSGEYEYMVPPLGIPEGSGRVRLEEMAAYEAVRLYIERASAMKSGFLLTEQNARAVVELCRRLDGLPLAIELAAARSKIFPPYVLLARLGDSRSSASGTTLKVLSGGGRDMPDRQQTLRSAIDWSYRLLTPEEQRLFAHLSVFAGGWTLEAAEGVCCPGENTGVVDALASLVDKSLVQQAETPADGVRFSMLEVIREYARDRFEALSEEVMSVRRRHAEYFLHLTREADAHYWGPEQSLWQRRLIADLDNLRAALAWARDSNEVDLALQLAGTLRHFWFDSGLRMEGRTWLEDALRRAGPTHRTVDRAAALLSAGECNWLLNDLPAGRIQFEESLGIYRELGDGRGTGWALHGLAVIVGQLGDLTTACSLCEEALLLSRAAGDRPAVALELHGLGLLAMRQGDEQTAQSRVEESRQIWQELGDTEHLCLLSNILGDLARLRGQYSEAVGHYRECLELIGEQGPQGWRALYLRNLGLATYRVGDEQRASQLLVEALVRFQELGDRRGLAECVAGLACLAAETEPERMARLFGAATATIEGLGPQLNPSDQADYDCSLAIARRQLGNEAFDAAWTQGRTLTLEQAVTEAVEDWPQLS